MLDILSLSFFLDKSFFLFIYAAFSIDSSNLSVSTYHVKWDNLGVLQ